MSDTENIENLGHGSGLKVGDSAADFDLPDEQTMPWVLHGELRLGPAVLAFYRGDWSPYCNGQLAYYARDFEEFEKRGARVVGISLDPPRHNLEMVTKLRLPFPLLSDPQGELARLYGLWNEEEDLPHPSVVVVDPSGKVRFCYRGADFADQPETSGLFDVLDEIASEGRPEVPVQSPAVRVAGDDMMKTARPEREALSLAELIAYFRGAYFSNVALEDRFGHIEGTGREVFETITRHQNTVRSYSENLRETATL